MEGLIIQRNFAFQIGLGMTIKTAFRKHYENRLKQLKTASTNSPWAYTGGLIIGRNFASEIWRAYYYYYYLFFFFLEGGLII